MLERLNIHNVREITAGVIEDIEKFNIFVGENMQSRKTTVMEMLYLAAANRQVDFALGQASLSLKEGNFEVTAKRWPGYVILFNHHLINAPFPQKFIQWAEGALGKDWPGSVEENMQGWVEEILQIEGATVELGGEVGYVRFPGKGRLPIEHLGDGICHATKVLVYITTLAHVATKEKPGLFLWEYPEIFVHPTTLDTFLRRLLKFSMKEDKHIQFFLSSHSLEVLAMVTAFFQEHEELREQYRVFHLELKDGEFYATKFRFGNVLGWLEAGFDVRSRETMELPFYFRYITEKDEGPLW